MRFKNEYILNKYKEINYLNSTKSVGAVMKEIRLCKPLTLSEWEDYYYTHVRTKEALDIIGKKLYESIPEEIKYNSNIDIEECIQYMKNLVINRTFFGYKTETSFKDLIGAELSIPIKDAPNEYDALFHLDLMFEKDEKIVYIQVKPETYYQTDLAYDIEKAHDYFLRSHPNSVIFTIRYKKAEDIAIINQSDLAEIKYYISSN